MKSFFDPKTLEALTFDDFAALTDEYKAGKLIVHTMKIKGQDYHVWTQYDQSAVMTQRCMVRSDLWEAQCQQN